MSKKKRKKNSNKTNQKSKGKVAVFIEYYNAVLNLLHIQLAKSNIKFIDTPKECSIFWTLIPQRIYNSHEAHKLLDQYLKIVEDKIAFIIKKHSLGYWLHIYRRLSPRPIGKNKDPQTTLAVRSSLEAAFQKYAKMNPCDRVASSTDIPIEKVLNGMLMSADFSFIRAELQKNTQLVLTNFGLDELIELYNVERLSYEIWRTMATMRTVGKGANLVVQNTEPYYYDTRDDELAELIEFYDNKQKFFMSSISGVMVDQQQTFDKAGYHLIPYYNVNNSPIDEALIFSLKKLDFEMNKSFITNFKWSLIALKEYYTSHSYYNEEYFKTYNIEVQHIIIFLSSLLSIIALEFNTDAGFIFKMYQRAYEGPYTKEYIIDSIKSHLEMAIKYLNLDIESKSINVERIFEFLSLNEIERYKIDVPLGGPMKMFLPFNQERFFIEYAWISWILYTFFWGIKPSDQNFKGIALELIVNKNKSILPTNPYKAIDNSKKQIDASYELEDYLVIVECKTKGQSFGFQKGDIDSIKMRERFIYDSLIDVDTKAEWLIKNPIGRNFNISKYKGIIPILVTPFIEFIPSKDKFYWLNNKYARVFTSFELDSFISHPWKMEELGLFNNIFWNIPKMIIIDN